VLFCDLVGSTEIAAQLDPEEWREVVAGYHRAAADAIKRYGGYVAQYLGDGVMAYFGWPEAHDNDGERAARAGLAILEGVQKLNHDFKRSHLIARVGINSGAVVVGAGSGKNADVYGETPNIAARLQATSEPGTVVITAATHRLISGLFVVEALGPRLLKGISTPQEVFRVARPTGVRGRLRAARGLTPFVGREEELRLLLGRWERTREGEGQLALITGEPGIGKSRLVSEFHDRIRDTPHIWMESAGEQFFENSPLHAISEMLTEWLQLQSASTEEQFQVLERALASAGLRVAEVAPLIADLLQLPAGERYSISTLTAEEKRRRLLAAFVEWVLGAARLQPLVMVVEDLHWLDPSTLELLQLLAERGTATPVMLLYTARPEFRAQWPMGTHNSQITLNRLSSRDVREMVALVAARNALTGESVDAVVERTGGVPLFVEELTRALLESGSAAIKSREIPATLHDSLMARLDRLGPAKGIIQIGAVIGNEFSYRLLHAVRPIPDEDLQGALSGATDAELVYVRGIPPDATYQFKHALIRDTAYEGLLKSRRKELHSRIAEVLLHQFSNIVASAPERLAHHYTEANLIEQAILYWQQAGQQALERSANKEAIQHLTKGLEQISMLPETPQHLQQELMLRITLGAALMVTKGFASSEAQDVYVRAGKLAQQIGEGSLVFTVFWALWVFHEARGEHRKARDAAAECLRLAQAAGDSALLLEAHHAFGVSLLEFGEFAQGLEYFERGAAIYDPSRHAALAYTSGQDSGVACLSYQGWALWFLGYPDEARKRTNGALALAHRLAHPVSTAAVANIACWVYQFLRDRQAARAQADAAAALSTEQEFALWRAMAMVGQGWAACEEGRPGDGITQLGAGLSALRSAGAEVLMPYFLSLLAQAYAGVGQVAEALSILAEAQTVIDHSGESWWQAELYRLKGEFSLRLSDPSAENEKRAEEYFHRAHAVARGQRAKSLELRDVMSLSRLWQRQGKKGQAHQTLADIYNSFTEGFDTADLKDAKALLDELSR
jgi:predicted ATPase/class 3 adenylate cyclase